MAIQVTVQNRFQIIVPVRFDRAVRGFPVLDAPDVDDRGWINNRAAGLKVTDARGALVGITVGDTVRLKVVREDIDDTIPLFVSNTGAQIKVAAPAGGGPIPDDGVFSVTALSDRAGGSKLQVRLGSADGPVIGEADVQTFTLLTLNVTPHICTIHKAATVAEGAGVWPVVNGARLEDGVLKQIFDVVRAIWRPAGLDVHVSPAIPETYTGFSRDDFASANRFQATSEQDQVIRKNQVANTCNMYFVRNLDQCLGLSVHVENRAASGLSRSGSLIAVEGNSADDTSSQIVPRGTAGIELIQELGSDIAHELGHFLTLPHVGNVDFPGPADTYSRRRLMHPATALPDADEPPAPDVLPRFNDIGYGTYAFGGGRRGCLVTLKDHPTDTTDGEVATVRKRFRSPNLYK